MFNLEFRINKSKLVEFKWLGNWHGRTPFAHKYWESQIYRDSSWITFQLRISSKEDHAGLRFEVGLLTYTFEFNFYDNRHWDHENQKWSDYEKSLL